jgi:tetratricopeptide (TPR) repeat protein
MGSLMRYLVYIGLLGFLLQACGPKKQVLEDGSEVSKEELSERKKVAFGNAYMEATKQKVLGNYDKAGELYRSAIAIDPNSAAAHYELGVIYSFQGNNPAAFEQFREAHRLDSKNYWYHLSYATYLETNGNIEDAIKEFKSLVKNHPEQLQLKYELAKLLIEQEKAEESIAYLNMIEEEIGISEEISNLKQRIYLADNNLKGAVGELEKLIEAYPQELKYYGVLADMYLNNGKKDEALEVLKKMQEIDPDNYRVQLSLAAFHAEAGNEEEYFENIKKAISNPSMNIDEKVKFILSEYQIDSEEKEAKRKGIALCSLIVETHPSNAKAHALLADFLYFDNQLEAAKQAYFNTIELDSSRFPIWNQLLVILSESKDYQQLENYGKRAIELFPNQPSLYLLYAYGLSEQRKYEEANDYLKMGADLVVDNPALKGQFYSNLGDNLHSVKSYKESDRYYEKALEVDPNNVYVLNNYSYYLSLRKNNLDKAKAMSLKSNQLMPGQSSFQDTYAWILYQLGNYEEALEWINKALNSTSGAGGVLLEHKGDILYQLGNEEEAVEFWKKANEAGGASEFLPKKIADKKLYE